MQIKIEYSVFTDNGVPIDRSLVLPVNPENINITESIKSQVFSTVGGSDRSVLGNKDLRVIDIASFFPLYESSYWKGYKFDESVEGVTPTPRYYIDQLEAILNGKRPVTISIFDDSTNQKTTNIDINMSCFLTKFTYGEKGGSLDVGYSLSFQERKYVQGFWKSTDAPSGVSLDGRPTEKPSPKVYVVRKGDNLWKISQKIFGDGDLWPRIYNENKDLIGGDPNLILPGQRLVLTNVQN